MDTRKYVDPVEQDPQQRRADFVHKLANVRQVLVDLKLDGAVLSYAHNFAWLTGGGRIFINMASDVGVGSIYVDATHVVLLTNAIEGHRLINEELIGLETAIELHEDPWYAPSSVVDHAKRLAGSDRVAVDTSDTALEQQLHALRLTLTSYEQTLLRALGRDCGRIVADVARSVRPNRSEYELTAQLAAASWAAGIAPIVLLVAADERIDAIRHPLPTPKRVKQKAMLVLCGRRAGFVVSVTRIVYITTAPDACVPMELIERHDAATFVDAVAIAATVPGAQAIDIFAKIQHAYATRGFQNEWTLHHQGGAAGYRSREWIATPASMDCKVQLNQAFAWNPSVTGTKSEDTMLLRATTTDDDDGGDGDGFTHEILSASPDWPMVTHVIDGVAIERPGILHLAL